MSPQPSTAASVSSTASSEGKEKKSSWLSRSKHSVLSSLSSNTTTTVQAVRRTKEEKSGKAHDLEPAESINKSVSSVPATLERVFLGAVKDDWPLYSCRQVDYRIGEPIGFGASSVVHLAKFYPPSKSTTTRTRDEDDYDEATAIVCAIKIVDVDRLSKAADIDRLRRETQLMALSKHTNVLRVRGEWVDGSKLYIAVRYMSPGSLLDIARWAFPDGFEESVIATVLKQALDGLTYLHQNGWLHRDIKAANLLVDDDGTVLLADFGVSSSLFLDATSKKAENEIAKNGIATTRKSFVGTPCWMAPEIIERKPYDSKADIWSLGITALELTLGRAPNSYFSPEKILAKLIQEPSPALNREGGKHKYGKALEDFVAACLQKNPTKRPASDKLSQHPFLRLAKKKSHLVNTILVDLPSLQNRQQRRRVASSPTVGVNESWDFNSTAPSHLVSSSSDGTAPSTPAVIFGTKTDPFLNFAMSCHSSANPSLRSGVSVPNSPARKTHVVEEGEGEDDVVGEGMVSSKIAGNGRREGSQVSFDFGPATGHGKEKSSASRHTRAVSFDLE